MIVQGKSCLIMFLPMEPFAKKIPEGTTTRAISFIVQNTGEGKKLYESQDEVFRACDILVGIELASGCFFVEGSSLLYFWTYL